MITVIGKLKDTVKYAHLPDVNIMFELSDYSPEQNREFIDRAFERGDALLIASWTADGVYREELIQLLRRLTR